MITEYFWVHVQKIFRDHGAGRLSDGGAWFRTERGLISARTGGVEAGRGRVEAGPGGLRSGGMVAAALHWLFPREESPEPAPAMSRP
jgi:hypothetical protein